MATISVDVPDAAIPDLTQALALRMQDASDPAVAAIAAKVIAGTTTTATEKQILARGFMREMARSALLDWRGQQASVSARDATAAW